MRTVSKRLHFEFGRRHNGILMAPEEFDAIDDYDDNYRYELLNGVLIVNPMPSVFELDPNEELGHWLRNYQERKPDCLDKTVYGAYVSTAVGRRIPDRAIWTGLGRTPDPDDDIPTIVVEFVSRRTRDQILDFTDKRDEYLEIGVEEYWVIDRFKGTMTVFCRSVNGVVEHVVSDREVYTTTLLPGFELPLGKLLAVCDTWKKKPKAKKS